MNNKEPTQEQLLALWNLCKKQVSQFGLIREDHIYYVEERGDTFTYWVKDICDIVGYDPDE